MQRVIYYTKKTVKMWYNCFVENCNANNWSTELIEGSKPNTLEKWICQVVADGEIWINHYRLKTGHFFQVFQRTHSAPQSKNVVCANTNTFIESQISALCTCKYIVHLGWMQRWTWMWSVRKWNMRTHVTKAFCCWFHLKASLTKIF